MTDLKNLDGLEIFLWYKCNVRCNFCYQKDLRLEYKDNLSKWEVETLLKDGYEEGKRFVIFAGGEPTLDTYLPYYIEYAKDLWFEHIRVHSNGFRFQKYSYLEDLYNKWLTGLILSFHGYGEVHDEVARVPGSFTVLQKSLENAKKLIDIDKNFCLDTNTVVYKWNYDKLLKLFLYLSKYPIIRAQVNYCSSLNLFSHEEKQDLMVEYSQSVPHIKKFLAVAKQRWMRIVIDNIPHCVISQSFHYFIDQNIKNDRTSYLVTGESRATYADTYDSVQTEKCEWCKFFSRCHGIPTDYYELFWDTCINPIHG